jgi:phosphoribosylformimino-5-aminoimidazole carboxamide ribotide isomerase
MGEGDTAFRLIPAVDVLGQEAVRLVQGRYDDVSLREPDPLALVARFVDAGADLLHVVDLTAARSGRVRPELFRQVVEVAGSARVQASGGIRTLQDADAIIAAGAARLVVGTAALEAYDLLERLVGRLGDRLVVALDVCGGQIRARGWEEATGSTVDDAIERCQKAGVTRLLCTSIDRDGTLQGPALDLLGHVARGSAVPVIAAGGVSSVEDLHAIEAVGCEAAIVGRALLESRIPLSALAAPG